MRVALRHRCSAIPDLLILDEPSNHLDLEAMLWLTEHLRRLRHTLLMVSHDRDLLNDVCDHIVHMTSRSSSPTTAITTASSAHAPSGSARRRAAGQDAAQRKHMQAFVDRFKAKASKARQHSRASR